MSLLDMDFASLAATSGVDAAPTAFQVPCSAATGQPGPSKKNGSDLLSTDDITALLDDEDGGGIDFDDDADLDAFSPAMGTDADTSIPAAVAAHEEPVVAADSSAAEDDDDVADLFQDIAASTDGLAQIMRKELPPAVLSTAGAEMRKLRHLLCRLEAAVEQQSEKAGQLQAAYKALESQQKADRDAAIAAAWESAAATSSQAEGSRSKEASEKAIVKIQAWARRHIARRREVRQQGGTRLRDLFSVVVAYRQNLDAEGKRILQRNRVMHEIVTCEEEYIRKLALIIQYFHGPLEKQIAQAAKQTNGTAIVTEEQHKAIFMNVTELLDLHAQYLLPTAIDCDNNWPYQPLLISAIFMQIVAYLSVYGEYVSNYEKSIATLVKLKKQNKKFAKWLAQAEKYPELEGLDLSDYTIMPVQRIPRYVLLLQDLIAHTPEYNVDYVNLQNALKHVKQLAEDVNDSLAASQNLQRVYQIQGQLTGDRVPNLLSPNRRFIRQGPVELLSDRVHHRELFLFSDCVLLAKRTWQLGTTTKALRFDGVVRLRGCVLEDLAGEGLQLGFRFHYGKADARKFITFLASDQAEKVQWMKEVTLALADHAGKAAGGVQGAATPSRSVGGPTTAAELAAEDDSSGGMSGYLMKNEGNFIKTWKQRWIHVTRTGLLYSYQDKDDVANHIPPLRSYVLSRFVIKELYVTDNMARFVCHLIQKAGSRQIILSTFSKAEMETWVNVLKSFVDLSGSSVIQAPVATEKAAASPAPAASVEDPVSQTTAAPSQEAKAATSGAGNLWKVLPDQVSDADVLKAPQLSEIAPLDRSDMIHVLDGAVVGGHGHEDPFASFTGHSNPLDVFSAGSPAADASSTSNYGMAPVPVGRSASATTITPAVDAFGMAPSVQPAPAAGPSDPFGGLAAFATQPAVVTPQKEEVQGITHVTRQQQQQEQSLADSAKMPAAPISQQDLTFQAKFNLGRDELVEMYFTLASGAFIYISKSKEPKVCIENLFTKGNIVIRLKSIAALHKSKPGLFGKGTGGQIELKSGKLIDLSGILKRRDCFQAIVDVGAKHGNRIRIYRDRVLES